jgi:DNA-binding response OmpR family regulator
MSLPVVMMSASRSLQLHAANLNVAGYVKKPFDLEELESKIEEALTSGEN